MKNYSSTLPSLTGVISDDYIYFEGLKKPQAFFTIRDGAASKKDIITLEQYWNDMYNLFLRKLTGFAGADLVDDEECVKLQALLQEIVKVKRLIENASKIAIMGK